jgi:uncharacterized oligopeptide transporter (OPT) family protein
MQAAASGAYRVIQLALGIGIVSPAVFKVAVSVALHILTATERRKTDDGSAAQS